MWFLPFVCFVYVLHGCLDVVYGLFLFVDGVLYMAFVLFVVWVSIFRARLCFLFVHGCLFALHGCVLMCAWFLYFVNDCL